MVSRMPKNPEIYPSGLANYSRFQALTGILKLNFSFQNAGHQKAFRTFTATFIVIDNVEYNPDRNWPNFLCKIADSFLEAATKSTCS
jgi:hypothetical protein